MTRGEYNAAMAPLIEAVAKINEKYHYSSMTKRLPEDVARSSELWDALNKLAAEFDSEHPLPPCKACGTARYASLNGACINFPECDYAPALGG